MKAVFNINRFALLLALVGPISACSGGEGSEKPAPVSSSEAREAAEAFSGGEAATSDFVEAEGYWEVEVELDGIDLQVEVTEGGDVAEVKSEQLPMGDLSFSDEALSYEEAVEIALEIQAGTIELWEFKLEGGVPTIWEFYIRDDGQSLWEIKLTADDGELIEIELTDSID